MVPFDYHDTIPTAGPSREDEHVSGFCGELFNLIRDLFSALQLSGCDPESDEAFLAKNEAGRFRLWGDGFDVQDGGLDELLEGSILQGAVIVQFAGIIRKLRHFVDPDSDLFRRVESTYLDSMLEKAEYLFPEAMEDEEEHLSFLETLEDIGILNDGLYELTPFLEAIPIEYEENDELENMRLVVAGTEEITETKALHINILDKFPEASSNPALVERLAELNMRRKKRIWDLKAKHEQDPEPISRGNGQWSGRYSPSSHAPSSHTVGSSAASIPSSSWEDDYPQSEASSMSSFSSMDQELIGRARIPPPPKRLAEGVTFECNLCFQMLHGIETKYHWKKHVLKDLQPYSCSFLHCPLPAFHLFNSRTEWINHEFHAHRSLPGWVCIKDCGQEFDNQKVFREHLREIHLGTRTTDEELAEIVEKCGCRKPLPESQTTVCPLCRETIPETRKSIRRHLGRHMEEISLAAVPPGNYDVEVDMSSEDDMSSSEEELEEEEFKKDRHDGSLGKATATDIAAGHIQARQIINTLVLSASWKVSDSEAKLLGLQQYPDWRKDVFSLIQAYNSDGACLRILSDDLRREVWKELGRKPEIAELRSQDPECNMFLDKGISEEIQDHIASGRFGFKHCHICKEVGARFEAAEFNCQSCNHPYCKNCTTALLPPSLLPEVKESAQAFLERKFLSPNRRSGPGSSAIPISPPPFVSLVSEPPRALDQPAAEKLSMHGRARTWSEVIQGPLNPALLVADDGFEVVGPRRPVRSRQLSRSSYASSADGSEISGGAITRTILIDRKHYPILIGSGGAALSGIIADSGGPVTKSEQSRIVRFPRQDSPSNKVVVTGSLKIVEGIIERMKRKVAELEGKEPPAGGGTGKEHGRQEASLGTKWKGKEKQKEDVQQKEKDRPSQPATPRLPSQKDINKHQEAEYRGAHNVMTMEKALEVAEYLEPEPRTAKSSRRRHKKKKATISRQTGDP